jgi:HPt (histidine-containing phosphotransfer) domain-containing protein
MEEREDTERRMHHLKVAIENLHAAGMPDVAHRLEQELERRRAELPPRGPGMPGMERLGAELRELHAQLDELRRGLREVREEMRRLHAEPR